MSIKLKLIIFAVFITLTVSACSRQGQESTSSSGEHTALNDYAQRLADDTKKAAFVEVIQVVAPFKLAVEECVAEGSCITHDPASNSGTCVEAAEPHRVGPCPNRSAAIAGIAAGQQGIPALPAPTGAVASLAIDADGTITATGTAKAGGATYILTPVLAGGDAGSNLGVTWQIAPASTCLSLGFCKQ
jgi:ABC-type Fe3+-hydroxamate transport system substrate-binding protein